MASKTLAILTLTLLLIFQFNFSIAQTTIVKGGYWTQDAEYPVSNINSTLFTHLFCGYADVNNETYRVTIPSSKQLQFSTFTETVQFQNPSVKTLLSISGTDALNPILASMVSQNSTRKSFIDSSISLARLNNFHGLDLDWQYPSDSRQMINLGYLLTEWRAAIVTEARNSSKSPLLLSCTVLVLSYYYDASISYPILAISNSLDWINVIAYGYYGPTLDWTPNQTGPWSALYNPADQENSGDFGVRSWIQAGLSPKKIVLGFPFYGYSWRLVNASNNGLFAPANCSSLDFDGDGDGDGSGDYSQIRDYISQKNATKVFNESLVSDYCYSGSTWIGYDDVQSISTKVLYAKENGLLGYFAWHVGADDNWILSTTAFQTLTEESRSNSKTKFIVAVAVVVPFFLFLLVGILWWKIRLRRKRLREQEELGLDVQTGMFTSTQIKAATNDFDQANKIGEGGFGPVYKGILSDGTIVAIKQLSSKSKQGNREFVTELGMISGLQHPNLVKLYGCCVDRSQLSLVYEYMENNSLARALFGDGKLHLDWPTRHKICVGIARGLAYLLCIVK